MIERATTMQPASFSIAFAADVEPADREVLLLSVRANAREVQEASSKSFDWQTFVVIMEEAGKVAGGTVALIALGKHLYQATRALRKRGATPKAQLTRPGQPMLDLATASEQELLDWLLASKVDERVNG